MSKKINLLNTPKIQSYKPFLYPSAYERYKLHESAHWLPEEVPLGDDVKDWKKITQEEREFIHVILNLFTQSDIQVGSGYDVLLRIFKPTEVQMMLRGQAARENIHIDAYSTFQDTIGFPDETHSEFLEYEEMSDKMEYIEKAKVKKYEDYLELAKEEGKPWANDAQLDLMVDKMYRKDVARMLAIYGALTEGVALFSSFIMLLNYQRRNLMKGMCQIVSWSIRDEEMHVQNNAWLFRNFIEENLDIWDDDLKKDIYTAAREMVAMEDKFIELAFKRGVTHDLTESEMKLYIRFTADRRLLEIGLKPEYGIKKNPLPWVEELLNTPEFTNFFESKPTEYGKGMTEGDWEDVRATLEITK
jgi:ribonucleoside-diphosphate reductase beta chain